MRGRASPSKLALTAAVVAAWKARQSRLKGWYTPAELEPLLGMSMRKVAAALCLLGWRREKVWHTEQAGRKLRVYWVPPGADVVRPRRGRPRFDLSAHFAIT